MFSEILSSRCNHTSYGLRLWEATILLQRYEYILVLRGMSDVNIIWKALRIWEAAIFEVSENLWVVLRSTCLRRIFLSRSDSTFDSCIFDGSGAFLSWNMWLIMENIVFLFVTAGSTRCSVCHDVILLILLEAMQHPLVSTVDALHILHPTQGTIHPSNLWFAATVSMQLLKGIVPQFCFY